MDSRSIALQIEKCRKGKIYVGYYDTYLPYIIEDGHDWSYPAPEMQLLWRLDDLQDRLEELTSDGATYSDEYIISVDEIKYALPEEFCDICQIERTIELAKDDLVNKYGLPNLETLVFEEPETIEEKYVEALTMFEIIHKEIPKAA